MRTTTLFLAAALLLPGVGAFAQSAPTAANSQSDSIDLFKNRGTPGGRVGGATRGLHKETEVTAPAATSRATTGAKTATAADTISR